MTNKRPAILLVEDERDVRELISLHLHRDGYQVEEARDGQEGLTKAAAGTHDLLILDWMMPGLNGVELAKAIRKTSRQPILMVTARVEAADIVLGLEAGADDYVTKPFEAPVLMARVRALLRRASMNENSASSERLTVGALAIDLSAHEVVCEGERIALTPSEFNLLVTLVQNRGKVLTRDQLIDQIRGVDVSVVARAIDTHVFGLRKKLGSCAEVIETIRGVGYRVKGSEA